MEIAAPPNEATTRFSGTDFRVAHHIAIAQTTIAECLGNNLNLSQDQVCELFDFGAIYLNKHRLPADAKMEKGDYLRIHLQPKRFAVEKVDWGKTIVHDDDDYLIVDKPPGIPVHATVDNKIENVLASLERYTGYRLFSTQRLDIPVGGLFVLAKTPEFQRRFNRWLIKRLVYKEYAALVKSPPPVERHVHYMQPSERAPKVLCSEEKPGWLRCELTILGVENLQNIESTYEVRVLLHTGRTHQIRTQLTALGSPIIGDTMYGSPVAHTGNGIALYSSRLEFPAPDGSPQVFEKKPSWI